MKRMLVLVAVGLVLLLAVVSIRTLTFRSKLLVEPLPHQEMDNQARIADRFARALQFETVTGGSGEAFLGLHQYLAEAFPLVHRTLTRETVGEYSLLYTWQGSDPSAKPILLLAHTDVVPVEPGTEADWTYPPFGGDVADGYIWGRGALDMKVGVVGILEAVETLLREGFGPRHTIYLAFGHDEESGDGSGRTGSVGLKQPRRIHPSD